MAWLLFGRGKIRRNRKRGHGTREIVTWSTLILRTSKPLTWSPYLYTKGKDSISRLQILYQSNFTNYIHRLVPQLIQGSFLFLWVWSQLPFSGTHYKIQLRRWDPQFFHFPFDPISLKGSLRECLLHHETTVTIPTITSFFLSSPTITQDHHLGLHLSVHVARSVLYPDDDETITANGISQSSFNPPYSRTGEIYFNFE